MSNSRNQPIPPSYAASLHESTTSSNTHDDSRASVANDLPAYGPTRHSSRSSRRETPEMKEFPYTIGHSGREVVNLVLMTEKAFSKHIPTVLQDSPVKGRIHLNLDKPETIQSVAISVRGQYLTGASPDQHRTFLELTHTLWSPTEGDPQQLQSIRRDGSTSSAADASPVTKPFNGKLQGQYTWPFSIDLPKEVSITCGLDKRLQSFPLPQTFNERYARGSINYELVLRITRNRFRPDYRIPARFGYIPLSHPPPYPALRRLSYQEGVPLLGPTIDPEGWFSDTPVTVKGTIFSNRLVHVSCTLCLAKPLSYTRSTLIPLFLRLESDDQQALDLLSTPKAIVVKLKRRIRYHPNPTKAQGTYALRDTVDYYEPAIWWPSTEGSEEPLGRFRFLNGEIHLSSDVKPSSAMADFRLEYCVTLTAFDVAGFEPLEKQDLLEYPVEIVTCFASGPRPRRYAPPGYESDTGPRDFLFPED